MQSLFGFLWIGCSQTDEVVQQQMLLHAQWSTLREEFQQASSLYTQESYPQAVEQFRSLHTRYPNSRAVLEGLLLAELHHKESLSVGYTRIQQYMLAHPGDVDFRLIQAKFHLQMDEVAKAKDDLELLLFNQSIHPWTLAQDPFLRHYQSKINLDKLSFELIRLLEVDVPTSTVVEDVIDIRVSFLHLSSCHPNIPPFEIGLDVQTKKLIVYQETIDTLVSKTTFVQSIITQSVGSSPSTTVQIQCDSEMVAFTLPSVSVISLHSDNPTTQLSTLTFPNLTQLEPAEQGVPWTVYINHVEAQKGFWNPSVKN